MIAMRMRWHVNVISFRHQHVFVPSPHLLDAGNNTATIIICVIRVTNACAPSLTASR